MAAKNIERSSRDAIFERMDSAAPAKRIAEITRDAAEAFGNLDKAMRWLHKRNRVLAGEKPVNLLNTEAGIALVKQALGTIEHGGVA